MKALRGTLTFVLGMIIGIILFVVGIGGAAYAISTSVSIGQLQNTLHVSVFDPESEILDKSIFDVVVDLIDDIKNIDKLTINTLIKKYGLPIPKEVSGLDISVLFDIPILQVPNNLGILVNSITLADIGELVGLDFSSYNIPVLTENLKNSVQVALNAVLSSIDSNNMTLRAIEQKFGLSLGDNEILSLIKDAPLSAFADIVTGLTVGTIIEIDTDTFVKNGENAVFVKTNRYERILPSEFSVIKDGASKYIAGTDNSKNLIWKELRYVQKETMVGGVSTTTYVVDNTSNGATIDPENKTDYFRLMEYEAYDTEASYPDDIEFFVPALTNGFTQSETDSSQFVSKTKNYISLKSLFTSSSMDDSFNERVSSNTISLSGNFFYASNDNSSLGVATEAYGLSTEELLSADSKLSKGHNGFFIAHVGTSAAAFQTLADLKINEMGNVADELLNVKIGDILKIDENSSQILISMKDKTINELSSSLDDLTLSSVVTIKNGAYVLDTNGTYIYQSVAGHFVPYDAALHVGSPRYDLSYVQNATGKYVLLGGTYYLFNAKDSRFNNLPRFDKTYDLSVSGNFVRIDDGGFYTLFNPSVHETTDRYKKIADFTIATAFEIKSNSGLHFYSQNGMTPCDNTQTGTLYVKGTPSAMVLQRLSSTSISGFNAVFDTLSLGDVMDIEIDIFNKIDSADLDHDNYYYDNGIYRLADSKYIANNSSAQYYKLTHKGAGNAVIKKLAYLSIEQVGTRMNDIIDDLSLGEVLDNLQFSAYVADTFGSFVYIKDGGFYTLFNAAIHDAGATRFEKIDGYSIASTAQIGTGKDLFYFDTTSLQMIGYTGGEHGTVYSTIPASSGVLQRLAKVKIANFATSFTDLLLSDVMTVDSDVYEKVIGDPTYGKTYYVYSSGVYSSVDSDYITANPSSDYFTLAKVGKGNVVLKKMAFLKIDEMATSMTSIINSLYLTDLIDIAEYFETRAFVDGADADTAARWIVAANPAYTTKIGEIINSYTFVYDSNGGFYKTATQHLPALDSQLVAVNTTQYFKYTAGTAGSIKYSTYQKANIYVSLAGIYLAYDPTNLAHCDMEKFYLYENGYFPASIEDIATSTTQKYFLDYTDSSYKTASASDTGKMLYVKIDDKFNADGAKKYYFSKLDSNYKKGEDIVYSKRFCETIYFASAVGEFVFYNNAYEKFEANNAEHDGLVRFDAKLGVIADRNQVALSGVDGQHTKFLSDDKIFVTKEQSATVLRAFAKRKVTMSSLGTAIKSFTIADLVIIEPGSMFDDPDLISSSIENIGKALTKKLQGMSIGEILAWGNISTMSPAVKSVLQHVTLADFFGSIELDSSTGAITINIEKLYGLK